MLRPIAFSVALEGLLPRYRPPRRPAPVIWEDRIHVHRSTAELHDVTAGLTRHSAGPGEPGAVFVQTGARETVTTATHTGVIAALAVRAG